MPALIPRPDPEVLRKLVASGITVSDIAGQFGVSNFSVRTWFKELGLKSGAKPGRPRGGKYGARYEQMREMVAAGMTREQISRELHCCSKTIRRALTDVFTVKQHDTSAIRELLVQGKTRREIAEVIGVSVDVLDRIKREAGISCAPVRRSGPSAKALQFANPFRISHAQNF